LLHLGEIKQKQHRTKKPIDAYLGHADILLLYYSIEISVKP